jgi:hypothetical protein
MSLAEVGLPGYLVRHGAAIEGELVADETAVTFTGSGRRGRVKYRLPYEAIRQITSEPFSAKPHPRLMPWRTINLVRLNLETTEGSVTLAVGPTQADAFLELTRSCLASGDKSRGDVAGG